MSKQVQHGRLRRKKNLLLGTILGIIILSGFGTFAALKKVQDTFQSTIQNEFGIKSLLHDLQVEMLEMNRNERDFLTSGDSFIKELHIENLARIARLAKSIHDASHDEALGHMIQEFEQQIARYAEAFDTSSVLVEEEKSARKSGKALTEERLKTIHSEVAAQRRLINQSFTTAEERVTQADKLIDAAVQKRKTIVEQVVQGMNTLVLSMLLMAIVVVSLAARMISGMMNSLSSTSEALEEQTSALQSVMDHVPEGIFVLLPGMVIDKHYARYLEEIFGQTDLAGQSALDVMMPHSNWTEEQRSIIQTVVLSALGDESFAWDVNAWQLPNEMTLALPGQDTKVLEFSWNAVLGKGNVVKHILVTVRNVTQLRRLQEENQQRQSRINLLMELINTKPQAFDRFYQEARTLIDQCRALSHDLSREIFIRLHTLKGLARNLHLNQLTKVVHEVEQPFADLQKGTAHTVDVEQMERDFSRLYNVLEEYSEMQKKRVTDGGDSTARMIDTEPLYKVEHALASLNGQALSQGVQTLCTATDELLAYFSEDLGETLERSFNQSLPIARELSKTVRLELDLPKVRLTSRVLSAVSNAWIHILRNAMDHGIETAEERSTLTKPTAGTLRIQGQVIGGALQLRITDDGRGLHLDGIRAKGLILHLIDQGETWSEHRIAELIFTSGFSTREKANMVSGRGVGMDAVRELLTEVGANVRLELLPPTTPMRDGYRSFALVMTLPAGLWHKEPAPALLKTA